MAWSNKLLKWYKKNKRDFPWRESKDPYRVWLSEIILQQTKVNQGTPFFNKFIEVFPSIHELAEASEDQVMKLWQGLGYYNRARNLHATAKLISSKNKGIFPSNFKELIKLKGVGDYTASAISSICFNLPNAVVDGNVYRFLSRFFGINRSIENGKAFKYFKSKATELMNHQNPGDFNQAMMEFGSIQCTAKTPDCKKCVFKKKCYALTNDMIYDLPVKKRTKVFKERFFNFLVFQDKLRKTLIEKRFKKDIWRNLYQFPLIETSSIINSVKTLKKKSIISNCSNINNSIIQKWNNSPIKYKLSHQTLIITFWVLKTDIIISNAVSHDELKKYPIPVALENFINNFFNKRS